MRRLQKNGEVEQLKTVTNVTFSYEKLQVWQMSKDFAREVYFVTEQFPVTEQFGLTSQVKRAAVSVMSNIAEGSARISRKDQAHFSQLAFSSLMEIASQLHLARDMGFVSIEKYSELRQHIEEISVKLNALRRSQLKDSS